MDSIAARGLRAQQGDAQVNITLRDYQAEAFDALRLGVREGHKRQILCAPTGAGKSLMGAALVEEALAKFSKTYWVVDRLALLDQSSAMFDAYGIGHGCLQSGHWRYRPWERFHICSAQTLARRGISEDVRLMIVDECHVQSSTVTRFMQQHPDLVCVGLSATPFAKGLGQIYSRVVNVRSTNQLIEEGWIVPVHQYVATSIDMSGAKLKFDGEWAEEDIEKRGMVIIGDVVGEWIKRCDEVFGGPVKTICFSATVAHGEEICQKFQAAGHNFQQISYKDGNDGRRRALIEEFRKPDSEIQGLVSVEALARGFDVTDIKFGIFCRPYRKSLSGWIQQLGRIMRPHEGKAFAIAHDHAGNALRFREDVEAFFNTGVDSLNSALHDAKPRKEKDEQEKKQLVCGCGFVLPVGATRCPACGRERPRRAALVEQVDGEMLQLTDAPKKALPDFLADKQAVWRQICYHALERKKGDQEAAERFAKAQFRSLYDEWPYKAMRNIEPEPPSQALVKRIQSNLVRWVKRRERQAA